MSVDDALKYIIHGVVVSGPIRISSNAPLWRRNNVMSQMRTTLAVL